jgi:hypothetical protein
MDITQQHDKPQVIQLTEENTWFLPVQDAFR